MICFMRFLCLVIFGSCKCIMFGDLLVFIVFFINSYGCHKSMGVAFIYRSLYLLK